MGRSDSMGSRSETSYEWSNNSENEVSSSEEVEFESATDSKLTTTAKRPRCGRAGKKRRKWRENPNQEYPRLLNSMILGVINDEEGNTGSAALPPSQIGASYWTSEEKERFFSGLSSGDSRNLHSLSKAIGTKAETEVSVYLKLLQDGVLEADATLPGWNGDLLRANVPAALEIRVECQKALNKVAQTVREEIEGEDIETEKQIFGNEWLVDERFAQVLEERFERGHVGDDIASEPAAETNVGGVFAAAQLLRPASFVALSTGYFMNGPLGTESNWREFGPSQDDAGPAMMRTALDDFYNLTVSLTRRLVQVSLFQATSRLRAQAGPRRPDPHVRRGDVFTARAILKMDADRKRYWARLARRLRLDVYSDSRVYRDGRPGTKNGVKLSYDEVETELGLHPIGESPLVTGSGNGPKQELESDDSMLDEHMSGSDTDDQDLEDLDNAANAVENQRLSEIFIHG